jgi:Trm5-related predicted tRNA methylase
LTAEPLVKEPLQEEMEEAICNLKTNKASGEDITAELIKNASRELKEGLYVRYGEMRRCQMTGK